jgi:hypothetical protein
MFKILSRGKVVFEGFEGFELQFERFIAPQTPQTSQTLSPPQPPNCPNNEIEQQTQQNQRRDGKVKSEVVALDADVAGEAPQPVKFALQCPGQQACDNEHSADSDEKFWPSGWILFHDFQ